MYSEGDGGQKRAAGLAAQLSYEYALHKKGDPN
jgi:hypothetical protein